MIRLLFKGILLLILTGCELKETSRNLQFDSIDASHSKVTFVNKLECTQELNPYTFRNFYNGAGVALGDVNNDGLVDIYFAGNLVDNALYLNEGDFQFKDITKTSGVACPNTWSTGVTMADVNNDGWLDIFVCKSGPNLGGIRHNELFINNKNSTFTESAEEWGVADAGLSLHAAFFDYDRDGDLDFYLLNNSNRSVGIYDLRKGEREERDTLGGNKLYQNLGNRFIDVTQEAGILASSIGYGLGLAISDINVDGWPDIFISNDFFERDYLYINNGRSGFKESLEEYFDEISLGSMGADIADINNDMLPDIFVTDMLPETWAGRKTKITFESYDKFVQNYSNGFHRQFNRNMLHLNQGKQPYSDDFFFVETGRYSGVSASNWSWGSLIADFDNDGLKDIFVASGIPKDLLDQDYINYDAPAIIESSEFKTNKASILKLIEAMPETASHNFLFHNRGDGMFHEVSRVCGLEEIGFSNGATYSDLNNDGLLDLVINRINGSPLIYRNSTINPGNFVQFRFESEASQTLVGTKIEIHVKDSCMMAELYSTRGYCSSSNGMINVGLGKSTRIDSVLVLWPDGHSKKKMVNLLPNRVYTLKFEAQPLQAAAGNPNKGYYFNRTDGLPFTIPSYEPFIDFNRDKLGLHNYSNSHARVSVVDVNLDGFSDFFLFGNLNVAPVLWLSGSDKYTSVEAPFKALAGSEVTDCAWVDVTSDGFIDLFVTCGGNRFARGAHQNTNRLFINNGNGEFNESEKFSDSKRLSSAFVRPVDFSGDGKQDLIIGHSFSPFQYGGDPGGLQFLLNENNEHLADVSGNFDEVFSELGHLTDVRAIDYDNDTDMDLVLCGHWMGIRIFDNKHGRFEEIIDFEGSKMNGLWNTIHVFDANGDGRQDFVAGNVGLNTFFCKSAEGDAMDVGDWDSNGILEQVVCQISNGKHYPMIMYNDLVKQVPYIRKVAGDFSTYSKLDLESLIGTVSWTKTKSYRLNEVRSVYFINTTNGFEAHILPTEAQLSSIYAITSWDVNADSRLDLILGGNNFVAKPEVGGQYSSKGTLLMNHEVLGFEKIAPRQSGIFFKDELRGIEMLSSAKGKELFLIGNSEYIIYKLK